MVIVQASQLALASATESCCGNDCENAPRRQHKNELTDEQAVVTQALAALPLAGVYLLVSASG